MLLPTLHVNLGGRKGERALVHANTALLDLDPSSFNGCNPLESEGMKNAMMSSFY